MHSFNSLLTKSFEEATTPDARVDLVMRRSGAAPKLRSLFESAGSAGLPGIVFEFPGLGYVEANEPEDVRVALTQVADDFTHFSQSFRALLNQLA